MKLSVICFVGTLCLLVQSGDISILKKQRDVLVLLKHINQSPIYTDWENIVKSWNVSEHASEYSNPDVIEDFQLFELDGWLPKKEERFCVMFPSHLRQSVVLFKLFYYAKTYETFFNTAVWARDYFNEGMFLYAYSLAVVHRPDMKDVILPPIYEINPHYFYDDEVAEQASILKQQHDPRNLPSQYDQRYGYTVWSNYTDIVDPYSEENSLYYYLQDVGIGAFYYYYNLYNPFWMDFKEYGLANDERGERFLFLHQQLIARYYLECLSREFGEISSVSWKSSEFGDDPGSVEIWERRIMDIIDGVKVSVDGKVVSLHSNSLNVIGNMIEGNPDSPSVQYFGIIWMESRLKLQNTNLEHFEYSPFVPKFYQLYQKIVSIMYKHLEHLPFYTQKNLTFPGVEIKDVRFDKLVTYFDDFFSDLSNLVYKTRDELLQNSFHMRVGQQRLNHKPFNYKIKVKSDNSRKSVVKVFIAPTYDVVSNYIDISDNFKNMVLLDYFVHDIKAGNNVISRSSFDSQLYGKDPLAYHEIYKRAKSAESRRGSWSADQYYRYFPRRYMLPHGTTNGKPVQFYVVIYPYQPRDNMSLDPNSNSHSDALFYPTVDGTIFIDSYSLMYPFDRIIEYGKIWDQIPNIYCYETKIYHEEDVNATY